MLTSADRSSTPYQMSTATPLAPATPTGCAYRRSWSTGWAAVVAYRIGMRPQHAERPSTTPSVGEYALSAAK